MVLNCGSRKLHATWKYEVFFASRLKPYSGYFEITGKVQIKFRLYICPYLFLCRDIIRFSQSRIAVIVID